MMDFLHLGIKLVLIEKTVGCGEEAPPVIFDQLTVVVVVDMTDNLGNESEVLAGEFEFSTFVD